MPKSINVPESHLNGISLLQLADDTALLAEERLHLCREFQQCLQFSKESYMYANVKKTYFLHLSDNPDVEPIRFDDTVINPAENNEYVYLGVKFVASNDLVVHIKKNFKDRSFHVQKFYDWLNINEATPVNIKVQVLYTCMFSAYLYGVETWWKIDAVMDDLMLLERKLLRSILGVKQNTPDDLLYLELDKHDIMASIKHRQRKFFQRLLDLSPDDAIASKIVNQYRQLPCCQYYDNIDRDIIKSNKLERIRRSTSATSTYLSCYHQLIDTRYNHVIYGSCLPERIRIVLTRWRLSNHNLRIETGRRDPYIDRHLRVCSRCNVLEDENHAIFLCPLYQTIRQRYSDLLKTYPSIDKVLNPTTYDDSITLGRYLIAIDAKRVSLNL